MFYHTRAQVCLSVLGIRLECACQKTHPDFHKPPVLFLAVKVTVKKQKKKARKWKHLLHGSQGGQVSLPQDQPSFCSVCSLDLPQSAGPCPGPWRARCHKSAMTLPCLRTELLSRDVGDYLWQLMEFSVRFQPQMQDVHVLFLSDIPCQE